MLELDLSERIRGLVTVACIPSAVDNFGAGVVRDFRQRFPSTRVRILEAQHVPAQLSLINAGLGVGAVPRLALAGGAGSALVCVPLREPEIVRNVGIVRRRGRTPGAAVQALHDALVGAHRRTPGEPIR
ncbi:LysR substrate-binding domain-containing protein [Variovorax ginsengisoli]|uniref:LysR substrate-binding domain-containing protein n=1 Tax=Variovorax ginsengisoli TaxID=363844 RepID=A0ABT8SEL0_9BURK|nr:LysR substrate-binding domain-containing protein [Variovorax ginsengisoli]MDN8618187.1 LysR substrate-binding domain-containing protein [Variovorax ginsengisoli]MDO1537357.1 LysR substrate-binding domain-containing protein [Variovorax ginsengisoli]